MSFNIQKAYDRLIGPILGIIIPLILAGIIIYLFMGGAFDITDVADSNGTVRIPIALVIVMLPLGYLFDLVGVTVGTIIIAIILLLCLVFSTKVLLKRLKELNN